MARPLPKDLEQEIAGTARRSEIRSVAVMGFIGGTAFGVGLGATFTSAINGSLIFIVSAGIVAALWFFAARRHKEK